MGVNLAGLVHGEQSFEWPAPVRAGDVVDATAVIASVEEKRGMTFLGIEHEATPAGRRDRLPGPLADDHPMSDAERAALGSVAVGDEMTPLSADGDPGADQRVRGRLR